MTPQPRMKVIFGAIAILAAAGCPPAFSNEYSLDYRATARYEHNDNVTLRPEDSVEISGAKASLPITFRARSDRMDASVLLNIESAKYDVSSYDSDDQNLQGKASYQFERGQLEGNAGFKRDSTRDSEFLDTGAIGLRAVRRENGTLGGSGSYMLTERNGLIAGADYSDVTFAGERYVDYQYVSGYGGWLHNWSERIGLRLQAYASHYENESEIKVSSETLGLQAGFETQITERLSAFLLAGYVNVDTEYSTNLPVAVPLNDSQGAFQGEGSLEYEEERYQLSLELYSGSRPSADGFLLQATQLDMTYRYLLSKRSRFDLTLIAGNSDALDKRIANNRDYFRGEIRLDYRLAQAWYVAGTYIYSYQDREVFPGSADSNAVYLSVEYRPGKRSWSR
ncbi:MAG: hypothetical protein AAGI44_02400 [Pseudomonadota bacterium]